MSPRILDVPRCPHCKTDLAKPTPRMCPSCGGSLQKRHLSIGCLTSAPPLIALVIGVGYGAARVARAIDAYTAQGTRVEAPHAQE